jgi:hypothetical protein
MSSSTGILGLTGLLDAYVPIPTDSVWLADGIDTRYRFDVYDLSARPRETNAVYAFAQQDYLGLSGYRILYIGKAEQIADRLSGHEKKETAIALGANKLLMHKPRSFDRISYLEAERKLIAAYAPILNFQHNPLGGIAGLLAGIYK